MLHLIPQYRRLHRHGITEKMRLDKRRRKCRRSTVTLAWALFLVCVIFSHINLSVHLVVPAPLPSKPSTADGDSILLHRNGDTGPNHIQAEPDDTILLLSTYDPARNPLLETKDSLKLPIKTGIVSISPLVGEAMHFIYDGVVRSSALSLIGVVSLYGENTTEAVTILPKNSKNLRLQPQDADLWIVDGARVAKLKRPFLDQLIHTVDPSWKVLFMDFSDQFQFQLRNYYKLKVWNRHHVRLAVRSIVQGRHYDPETNQIIPGRIASNIPTAGGPMLHAPYAVRSDIMDTLQRILKIPNTTSSAAATETALANAIFDPNHHRPIDVLHLWNISFKEGKSKLRNSVSKLIRSWNGTLQVNQRNLTTSIHEQGERRQVGRNMVDPAYVRALLTSKIVVVTQKDDWEDHYRLFESLSCGALILHDSMLAPPKELVNGRSIIFFNSLNELQERALYYLKHDQERLAVARRGWEMAMRRHRSWHRIEELVFGRPLNHVTDIHNLTLSQL